MKRKSTMLGLVSAFLFTIMLGSMWPGSFGTAEVAAQKGGGQSDDYEDLPLAKPLESTDPRSQLNPELLESQPMPFPEYAHQGAPIDPEFGASEASFNPQTGEERTNMLYKPERKRVYPTRVQPLWPGNLGPNAERNEIDADATEQRDNNDDRNFSVIGADNRTRITNTTAYPWRTMTKLYMTFPNNSRFICSGALINAKYVLTAGHCVYSHTNGGWARSIEVIPGLRGTYKPYGSAFTSYMRSYVGWTRDRDSNYDFALMTLDRNIGNSTGWLGYATYPTVNGITDNLAGYPGDRDQGLSLFYHFGQILSSTSFRLSYTIDTAGGQSGSNIYRIVNGQRYVFAVHTNGGTASNSGTRITSQRFDDLRAWIASGR